MAVLLPCQCQFHRRGFMDVREAVSTHRLLLRHRNSLFFSWTFGSERYVCRKISFLEGYKFSLCFSNFNCIRRTPIMSRKRGTPCNTSEACKIVWTIEADLEAGQLLYITGDPIELGSWEPEMALLMSPTEHTNLWKAQVKIACGVNVKYNYFIKGEAWSSTGIIWKTGPKFSLSIPLSSEQQKKILVRDSWLRFYTQRPPGLSWGSWIDDNHLPLESEISTLTRDDDEIVQSLESHFIDSNILTNEVVFDDEMYSNMEDSVSAAIMGLVSQEYVVETGQPVEEPWLIQSSLLFPCSKNHIGADLSKIDDTKQDKVTHPNIHNQQLQDTGQLFPERGDKLALNEPVSTMILINSSICTMQRIAIFEDGNIVELLLEPVKTNVQCDSVYLGVVTKLVPHMGGALVHIGNMRPSLMEIKQNRESFIFPPFRPKSRKQAINGSVSGTPSELCVVRENESTSDDIETIDDIAEVESLGSQVYSMHNDFEENEIDVDFDLTEVSMENMNVSIVDHGDFNADFKGSLDVKEHQHHLDAETGSSSLPIVKNNSNVSEISRLQDRKATNETMDNNNNNKWFQVRKGTKIIVQVVKEGLGTKGPSLTAYPRLRSRFWVLTTRRNSIGVSKKISGVERTRLKVIAKTLQPQGFGLTVRTVAAGHSLEELQKDLEGLISTWKNVIENAKSAALAADEGVDGAVPVILHRAMGQTLSVVQDYFNDKVERMVVDSPRTYHEVTNYLQEIAPDLCDRVELYDKKIPLFDEFNVEEEINNILSKRVPLANGGSLVIEQTEALVSIDVNGGHGMFGHGTSQEKAILEVNLAAARQIARELRLRDIGGIIVVDFIDMTDESHKRLVYEEVKEAVERDRSMVKVSELSRHGLMEITRKRVRPSVTFMISEPCSCCHATGRVEALETSFSKIEQEICRLLAKMDEKADPEVPGSWPKFILRVDQYMCDYLTYGKKTRLAILSSSLKVWLLLKVARGLTRGGFDVKPFIDEKANKNQHQVTIPMLQPTEGRNKDGGKKVTLFPVKKWKASRR